LKICFINPTVEMRRPIAELADILSARHEITVVWPRIRKRELADIFHFSDLGNRNLRVVDILCLQPRGEYSFPVPVHPGFPGHMARLVKEHDIVHMWTYFYPLIDAPLLMKKIVGGGRNGRGGTGGGEGSAKMVLTSDTFPSFSFDPGGFTALLMRHYARMFGHAIFSVPDRVAIYGDSMLPFAREAGVPARKTIVLPSGVHTGKFMEAEPNGIRAELGMRDRERLVLFAGMIAPRKGIGTALETAAVLRRKGVGFRMLFCGQGTLMPHFKRMARRLGVGDLVHFVGARRDMPEIMAASDALFLPSRGEGLPGVIMEAAAAGLPVVASRIPCIPDLIDTGRTGFLVEMDDVMGFASALAGLMENDALRERMGRETRENIRKWDWRNIAPRYESLYRSLLAG